MSEFDLSHIKENESEELAEETADNHSETHESNEKAEDSTFPTSTEPAIIMIDASKPVVVIYCPFCSLPCEYCQFGNIYESKCLPWIQENCPDVLEANRLADSMSAATITEGEDNEDKKKKKREVAVPKKKAAIETKIIMQLKVGQKRKMLTHVTGLDTIPDMKIKDIARAFGKKFSCGTSVGETATGTKEVVIQGDVMFQLPDILVKEYKVPGSALFIQEGSSVRPY